MGSAERLFLEKGVEQTAVEDITAGAGVSKGSFYLHFPSKGDLVLALRARFVDDLLRSIDTRVREQPADDWHGRLLAWVRACACGYLDATQLHALVFAASPLPSRQGMVQNPLIDHLAALLEAGSRADAWTLNDAGFTAMYLFNALHGVAAHNDALETDTDAATIRERLLADIRQHVERLVF